MDFLDAKKLRRHAILLYTGYVLIGIAILISSLVLVYQANGFGVNSKGQVVQNGLVFISTQPNPASIYLNGQLNPARTNNRLSVPAGRYNVRLSRDGYRDWQRTVNVQGGDVQHFDYPFLFPRSLVTSAVANYPAPGVASQSRDHRWLMVQTAPTALTFDVYDLKQTDPTQNIAKISLPTTVVTSPTAAGQHWEVVQWADDNQHVLLRHDTSQLKEYILVDRTDATKSVNLNTALNLAPSELTLINNRYDQYMFLADNELSRATLNNPAAEKLMSDVLEFKSYGSKTVLYVTTSNSSEGRARVMINDGNATYTIREVALSDHYLLDMAGFQGTPYVVLSASSENAVYVYKDPIAQLGDKSLTVPQAIRALHITTPTYVGFSQNAQYIAGENGNQFGVYDIFNKRAYVYSLSQPFDAPQLKATWMDGNRLTYVSNGKALVFDYDQRNQQQLMPASPNYTPFFAPDYRYEYTLAPAANGTMQLTKTGLRIAADL